jgi:hypothetical protein
MMQAITACQNCGKEGKLETWVGYGGIMDFVHGNYHLWCRKCILKAQIKECKKAVKRLPKLEKEYKKLK